MPARLVIRLARSTALTATCALLVACTDGPLTGDIIVDFPGTTLANPALLLYSGMEGAACEQYKPYVANPTVTLPSVSWSASCQIEVNAFAANLGAYGRLVDPLDPGDEDWFVTAISAGSLSVSLPTQTVLPVRLWLVGYSTSTSTIEAVRKRLLDKAYPVLDKFGTGFTLDTSSVGLPVNALVAKCSEAAAISTNAAIYDASKLNVYFVSYYGGTPGLTPANTCWLVGHPEIIFISFDDPNVTDPTLVHELGHALGLVLPLSLGGHTYEEEDFHDFNLMATNSDVKEVTVGQLYALNFSARSWINRTGSTLAKDVVRTCQDSWGAGVCPALTMKTPSGWPP